MLLASLFSAFCLLTALPTANPSIEIIHQQHLETSEGRSAFLVNQLTPYVAAADKLNQEIQVLAEKIKALSPQDDQAKIIASTEEMTQKMDQLLPMLPVLDAVLSIEDDLNQIEGILNQKDPLSAEQQQILDRVASLCRSIEKF